MNCQVCGGKATIHVTELRGNAKFHFQLCSQHERASTDGTAEPLSDAEHKRLVRDQLESSITDPALLVQFKNIFPDIFDQSPDDEA